MAGRAVTNFTAGSFRKSTGAVSKAAAKDAVPSGSVKEVLSWVGHDENRAAQALKAEEARTEPRVTVIEAVEKILSTDDD